MRYFCLLTIFLLLFVDSFIAVSLIINSHFRGQTQFFFPLSIQNQTQPYNRLWFCRLKTYTLSTEVSCRKRITYVVQNKNQTTTAASEKSSEVSREDFCCWFDEIFNFIYWCYLKHSLYLVVFLCHYT